MDDNDNVVIDEGVSLWEIESALEDSDEEMNFDYYYEQTPETSDRWSEMSYNLPAITGWDAFQEYEDQTPF